MLSYLDIVVRADSSPYRVREGLYAFISDEGSILGKVLPYIARDLGNHADVFVVDHNAKTLQLQPYKSQSERGLALARLMSTLRGQESYAVLKGWRNELYPVYLNKKIYFLIERSSACLLGLVTYGVHITGYVPAADPQDYKIWVPRRSFQKPTYPGVLDNTVAGGLGYPYGPWETCLKECHEEAGLDPEYTKTHLKGVGVVTYEFIHSNTLESEEGVFQPECEYLYDLVMEPGVTPKPTDGEVDEFYLMDVPEVQDKIKRGEFKYNCGLVLVDFFIRHGLITPENEKDYLEIVQRCHRALPYPLR